MRNLFVKTALVLCTTIIFLPATVFATEPQNTEITSAEEGFTDSDPSVSYENDNSLTLDEKEDDSTSTEPPAEDEKTPDKADTDKENPDPDIFTSGDDFGDGSKSNPFHVVIDIERIGDHAENIADLAVEKINKKLKYSSEALDEITEIYTAVMDALNIAITSYATRDINKAKSISEIENLIDLYQKNYRDRHIKRLYDGKCTANEGAIFLDLITDFERIGDHSTNIAENVIGNSID